MRSSVEAGTLTIWLEDRIDSSNAEAIENEIKAIRGSNAHEALVFNADDLSYISSAGLRVILRTRKEEPTLKLINANSEVYEIFDMTGFTEMMPIQKAYRRMSVDGCGVIGQGSNGVVYRLDADTIIKVYRNPDSLPDILRERELARKAFVMGIPTAIPYDIVRVGETFGSVFELLNAKPFQELVVEDPSTLDHYVALSVDLLKKIHGTELKRGDMPDQRQVVLGWAEFLKDYLPSDKFEKLYGLIEAVPESNYMMHGDYHFKNVMQQGDEVLLIDMDTLCLGDPVFEFGCIYLAYQGFGELNHQNATDFLGIDYDTCAKIWRKTLALYFGTEEKEKLDAIENKARIVGYTRLMRRTIRRDSDSEEGKAMIAHCKQSLMDLLDVVDTLAL